MIQVLFQYDAGPRLRAELDALQEQGIEVCCHPEHAGPVPADVLARTQAIWHVLQPVTAQMIGAAPALALVQKIGVGVNTIDLDAARAWADSDPYTEAGVFARVTVKPFKPVLP